MSQLVPIASATLPALVAAAGERAGIRFLEFFAANIRNPHTRRAYARAVRNVIVEILKDHKYRVSSVADGASMVDFLEIGDAVDCVVLDALMPGEASISLALGLKETCIPVVMISGSHDAMEYAERNDLQLLRKPFHTQELYNAINTALASG